MWKYQRPFKQHVVVFYILVNSRTPCQIHPLTHFLTRLTNNPHQEFNEPSQKLPAETTTPLLTARLYLLRFSAPCPRLSSSSRTPAIALRNSLPPFRSTLRLDVQWVAVGAHLREVWKDLIRSRIKRKSLVLSSWSLLRMLDVKILQPSVNIAD